MPKFKHIPISFKAIAPLKKKKKRSKINLVAVKLLIKMIKCEELTTKLQRIGKKTKIFIAGNLTNWSIFFVKNTKLFLLNADQAKKTLVSICISMTWKRTVLHTNVCCHARLFFNFKKCNQSSARKYKIGSDYFTGKF